MAFISHYFHVSAEMLKNQLKQLSSPILFRLRRTKVFSHMTHLSATLIGILTHGGGGSTLMCEINEVIDHISSVPIAENGVGLLINSQVT